MHAGVRHLWSVAGVSARVCVPPFLSLPKNSSVLPSPCALGCGSLLRVSLALLLLLLLPWRRPAAMTIPAAKMEGWKFAFGRCLQACCTRAAGFALLLLLTSLSATVAAGVPLAEPSQQLFDVVFSGSRWPFVYDVFLRDRGDADLAAGATAVTGVTTPVVNPAAAAVGELLTASLITPPGVTGISLRECRFLPNGLAVTYAVARFEGASELTNAQINALVERSNTSALQELYWRNGGPRTEKIIVMEAVSMLERMQCDVGCQYILGVGVPLLCCCMLCIPIFISLVSPRRSNLKLESPPPPPPPMSAQFCCTRHAATLTSSYRLLDAGTPHDGGAPDVVTEPSQSDGYPTGFQSPAVFTETDEDYYMCLAQQAFEAEKKRREDVNRWRRANGLPLMVEPRNSTRRPRVIVVEGSAEVPYSTMMDLDPEERAKLDLSSTSPPNPRRCSEKASPPPPLTRRHTTADGDVQNPLRPSFYASLSSADAYCPNKKPGSANGMPFSAMNDGDGDIYAHRVAAAHPPISVTPECAPPIDYCTDISPEVGRESPRLSPSLQTVREKKSLLDTGMIGGEILSEVSSGAFSHGLKGEK